MTRRQNPSPAMGVGKGAHSRGACMRAGTLVGLLLIGSACAERLDPQGCPADGPAREVVVLFDASDPLTPKHQAEIGRILEEMLDPSRSSRHGDLAVREKERVTVYFLESSATGIQPAEQICHPGDPANRSWVDDLLSGSVIARARWERFRSELGSVVAELFPEDGLLSEEESPILETIAVITARHARSRRADDQSGPAHLIIVSDLLQHTGSLSHYETYPHPDQVPREMRTDLSRVEVTLFRLERERYAPFQTPEHFYWWTDFVEEMGGVVVWQQPL